MANFFGIVIALEAGPVSCINPRCAVRPLRWPPSIPTGSSGSARTIWRATPGSATATMRYSPTCGFLGGGAVDEVRLAAFVARSPEVLKFFADCGIRFWLVRGVTDHYYEKAPGSHAVGRTVEAELISGVELGIGATAAPGGAGRLQCAEVRLTLRWRGLDSHFWFRAEMGLASRHHPRGAAEW
jgi:hypothetical protein